MVLQNRRTSNKKIVAEHELSYGAVETILHDHLGLWKITASGEPKTLLPVEKENRAERCKAILQFFQERQ